MGARKNPLWLLIIFSFLIVYCGVHFNISDNDLFKIFEKDNNGGSGIDYLYAATPDGIYAFRIDSASGALAALDGSPYLNPTNLVKLGALPTNGKILLANYAEYNKEIYTIPIYTDGTLGTPGPALTGYNAATAISLEPAGRYSFISYNNDSAISAYTIDYTNMRLSFIGSFSCACTPVASVVSPDGQWLYAGFDALSDISAYQINGDGSLTGKGSVTAISPAYIVMHPSGQYFYSCDRTTQPYIRSFKANSGMPVLIGSSYPLGSPCAYAGALAINSAGNYVFGVAYGSDEYIYSYGIDASGAISSASIKTSAISITYPSELALAYGGRFLYVAANDPSGSDIIRVFAVNSDGSMVERSANSVLLPLDATNSPIIISDMLIIAK